MASAELHSLLLNLLQHLALLFFVFDALKIPCGFLLGLLQFLLQLGLQFYRTFIDLHFFLTHGLVDVIDELSYAPLHFARFFTTPWMCISFRHKLIELKVAGIVFDVVALSYALVRQG